MQSELALLRLTETTEKGHQCHHICDFFGTFGFFVQFILAIVSFSALIVKRYQEIPRRPVNVFKYDAAKNGLGACLVHFMNIFIAMQFAGKEDPCPWYFIQILFDCTVVVFANFVLLRILERRIMAMWGVDISSGDYGDPPQMVRWLQQLGVWLLVVTVCKVAVTALQSLFQAPLAEFGAIILNPLCFNPHMELFIVVVLLPLVLNAFQFWIVDNYLMHAPEGYSKLPKSGLSSAFDVPDYGSNTQVL
mmetsp:Transcript_29780/g.60131  ORF Transcript_29780/g.60131 Transcript_29780/m.60131 type:complete len:248 (+) Transcript_29780:56-799(+)